MQGLVFTTLRNSCHTRLWGDVLDQLSLGSGIPRGGGSILTGRLAKSLSGPNAPIEMSRAT
jgi:hypothetical protein